MNRIFLLLTGIVLLCSCSSTKLPANTAAVHKPETTVTYPAQPVATPANVNFVYDYESLFSAEERKKLDSLARNFERSNLVSIKIATINDPAVTPDNFDSSNLVLLEEWSNSHGKSDKCMVISVSKNLRRIRIDYGAFVSNLLSTQEVLSIIENYFKPSFKENQYYQGTLNGLIAITDTIRKNIHFNPRPAGR